MTDLNSLYKFIYETPLAYDDETEAKVGTVDPETGTVWGKLPPKDATIEEIASFVTQMKEDGVLNPIPQEYVSRGASRYAEFNDGKTMFKWNYDDKKYGNQTKYEVQTYEKFKGQYGDVLPKFFAHGNHWAVVEKLKPFNSNDFTKLTKINKYASGKPEFIWGTFVYCCIEIKKLGGFGLLEEMRDNGYVFAKEEIERLGMPEKVTSVFGPYVVALLKNDNIWKIFQFLNASKTAFGDMHTGNVMFNTAGKMVVADFGFRSDKGQGGKSE